MLESSPFCFKNINTPLNNVSVNKKNQTQRTGCTVSLFTYNTAKSQVQCLRNYAIHKEYDLGVVMKKNGTTQHTWCTYNQLPTCGQ